MGARISDRIAAIAESATLAVDAKAKALKAAGRPVIGFGAGEPDFPTPDYIVEAAVAACPRPEEPPATRPCPGCPSCARRSPAKTKRDTGYDVEAAQVLVTNGGKQAVYNAFATLLDPGDEVLLIAPYWTTYPEAIKLAGGVPGRGASPTRRPATWPPSSSSRPRAPTAPRCCCSSRRPTRPARSTRASRSRRSARGPREHGLWVVTDEIYEHLVYGDAEMVSIAHSAGEKVVVLNGVAKTYAMTGWRVGWLIGPADVVKAATNLQSHATSNVANVSQVAALAAVTGDLSAVAEMRAAFDRRRQRDRRRCCRDIPGVVCPEPHGAFYAYPSVKGLLGQVAARPRRRRPRPSSPTVILDEAEVAVVPGEAFGTPGYVRMSYALGDDDLAEGVARIAKLVADS